MSFSLPTTGFHSCSKRHWTHFRRRTYSNQPIQSVWSCHYDTPNTPSYTHEVRPPKHRYGRIKWKLASVSMSTPVSISGFRWNPFSSSMWTPVPKIVHELEMAPEYMWTTLSNLGFTWKRPSIFHGIRLPISSSFFKLVCTISWTPASKLEQFLKATSTKYCKLVSISKPKESQRQFQKLYILETSFKHVLDASFKTDLDLEIIFKNNLDASDHHMAGTVVDLPIKFAIGWKTVSKWHFEDDNQFSSYAAHWVPITTHNVGNLVLVACRKTFNSIKWPDSMAFGVYLVLGGVGEAALLQTKVPKPEVYERFYTW